MTLFHITRVRPAHVRQSGNEAKAGLSLAGVTPPAPVVVDRPYPTGKKVRLDRGVADQEVVELSG